MTDREYALLTFIQENHRPLWSDVLNGFNPDHINENNQLLKAMLGSRIEIIYPGAKPPRCYIRLTHRGAADLQEERERRIRHALLLEENVKAEQVQKKEAVKKVLREKEDRKAEKRADRIFQVFLTLLSSLLSLIVGLLLEYHLDIIELAMSIF